MSDPQVCVVGSFAVGLTLRAERFPVAGETILAGDFDEGPGGKGSNQAVQVARLGGRAEFAGLIGTDSFGEIGTNLFAREGVGTAALRSTPERNTGVGFIILDAAGENCILLDPGANDLFSAEYVRAASDLLHSSAVVVTQLEIPLESARAAVELGRQAKATTILNPAPARQLSAEVLGFVDILTPNQSEARILLGLDPQDPSPDLEVAQRLRTDGVETVVMTRGGDGALVVTETETAEIPSFPVSPVDTTGAGDAFNGALATLTAQGRPLDEAVRWACAAGALACTKLGVIPSLPTRDTVARLIEGAEDE